MNMRRPYSLGLRLSWTFAGQTLLGLGAASAGIYLVMFINLTDRADAELARKSSLVRHLVNEAQQGGDLPTMRHKLDVFFVVHDDLEVVLEDAHGKPVYKSTRPQGIASSQLRSTVFGLPDGLFGPGAGRARITMDRSSDHQLLDRLAFALVVITLMGAGIVSAAGFWMVRRSLAPLHGLARQTQALRADRLGKRLSLEQPVHELQPWIDEFNELLGRLEYAYRQLEGFSADAAHELRTPLATLIGQTEVELSRDRSADALRDTLGSNLEELRRLSSIINDMLFLSRADNGARVGRYPVCSLAGEAGKVLEFYESALLERGLSARVSGEAVDAFDAGLIKRAISNLLSNAIRYAEHDSEVVVHIEQQNASVRVTVRNTGPALPPGVLPRLFDRFFRVQNSREGSNENHGLGLAIVKAIAQMHGGQVLASSEGKITSIGFTLATQHDIRVGSEDSAQPDSACASAVIRASSPACEVSR